MNTKHPAIMGIHIMNVCKKYLPDPPARILDPFAGIGTTAKLLPLYDVIGVEIEHEWASQHPSTICGDSLQIVPTLGKFDVILTSPAYGNRMADDFNATEANKRITYRHKLGRELSEGTTANLYFGKKQSKYEILHEQIWKVCVNALNENGLFILNCKDFISKGELQNVTDWHINVLNNLGLKTIAKDKVYSKGMRWGANSEKRIDYENVVCFSK